MSTSRRNKGFTITELVIVIAVIAILAAVLIPTFSNVVHKANQSADQQLIKSINVALYDDQVAKMGVKPANYVELMTVLNEAGFCDGANMYMISSEIKQDGKYLFWDKETNTVMLIDGIMPQFFQSNGDAPNYYNNQTGYGEGESKNQYGYILSTASSGDKGEFANWYIGKYGVGQVTDPVFSVVLKQYETNKAAGLTTATAITNWYNADVIANKTFEKAIKPSYINKTNGQVVTAWNKSDFESVAEMKAAAQEANENASKEAAKYLMGVVSLVNNGINLAGVDVKIAPVEIVVDDDGNVTEKAGTLDFAGATWTPIADQPRKTANLNGTFCGTLDMGYNGTSTTIKNLKMQENFINNSAELQTGKDAGTTDDVYMFNYGLFAYVASTTVKLPTGETYSIPASVKNITLVDTDLDLTNATVNRNGKQYRCHTDCAGILVGYASGDIVFENISIGTQESPAKIKAYDSVGVLVGRHYASKIAEKDFTAYTQYDGQSGFYTVGGKDYNYKGRTFVAKNCTIYANVEGDRRTGGVIGYNNISTVILDGVTANVTTKQNMNYSGGNTVQTGIMGYFSSAATVVMNNTNLNGETLFGDLYDKNSDKVGTSFEMSAANLNGVYADGSMEKILTGGRNALPAHTFVMVGDNSIFGMDIAAKSYTAAELQAALN